MTEISKNMRTGRRSKARSPGRTLLFITNPTIMLLATIFLLHSWKIPTNVHLDLVLEHDKDAAFIDDAASLAQTIQNRTVTVKEGRITYPGHSEIAPIHVVFPEQLEVFFEETGVQIDEAFQLSENRARIRLEGVANTLKTGTAEKLIDRRLTQFDNVRNSPKLVWTGVGLWLMATLLGWVRVYQELNT
jgi:hypothetical protein